MKKNGKSQNGDIIEERMMRIKDSPELFGRGIGLSTVGMVACEWCGETYNKENEDEDGEIIDTNAPSVEITVFAGKQVADCCFEKIENEMLRRADDFLDWLGEIEQGRKKRAEERLKKIQNLKKKKA